MTFKPYVRDLESSNGQQNKISQVILEMQLRISDSKLIRNQICWEKTTKKAKFQSFVRIKNRFQTMHQQTGRSKLDFEKYKPERNRNRKDEEADERANCGLNRQTLDLIGGIRGRRSVSSFRVNFQISNFSIADNLLRSQRFLSTFCFFF